jgi:hypothetical protein
MWSRQRKVRTIQDFFDGAIKVQTGFLAYFWPSLSRLRRGRHSTVMPQQRLANAHAVRGSPEPRIVIRTSGLRRLDARRRKLIKGISQGMNIAEAGIYAGYKHRQAAHRAFRSIQLRLPQTLEKAGYSVDQVLTEVFEKLHAQLDAKKTRFFHYRGIVLETREVEDHRMQLRAVVEICKILGFYPGASNSACESEPDGSAARSITMVAGTPEEARKLGTVFIDSRSDSKQLSAGVDPNEDPRRRPGPKPDL